MPELSMVLGLVESDLDRKKYSQAMKRLVSVSNENSHNLQFLGLLAMTQKCLGDFSGHIKTLEAIAKITGSQISHLDYMAALYNEGRLNEALDVGLMLQDQEMTAVNAKYFTRMMIKIYLEFCDYEGVEEVLQNYVKNYELDDLMFWGKGFVALAYGHQDDALDFFRKALNQNPRNDGAWVSIAMLHDEMGDRELALANLERALDVNPVNATGLKLLARWHKSDLNSKRHVIERLSLYLSRYNFDEELSLCYVQLLHENNAAAVARFELEKQLLNNPYHEEFLRLKNNLQV